MKIFSRLVFALAALSLSGISASGAALVFSAAQDNALSLSSGGIVPQGNLARAGFFDIDDATIIANNVNLSFLNSHFTEFGTARIGDGFAGANGIFQSSRLNRPNSDAEGFGNKQIYMWVFASTDNSSVPQSVSTAFEHGIFYVDMANAGNWRFRLTGDVPNDTAIDLSDLTDAAGTSLVPGAHVVVGTFPKGVSPNGSSPNFGLVIPEPSTAVLLGLGFVSVLTRRQRQRKCARAIR
jgi:hypothetical protein